MIVLGHVFLEKNEDPHAAGAALRDRMLTQLCGITSPEIRVAPGGKPYLSGREDVFFSVSHSGSLAVCAVSFPGTAAAPGYDVLWDDASAPEIGADAEIVRDISHAPRLRRLAERFFAPDAAARLEKLPDAAVPRAFCFHWTACESAVKMTGEGFARGFSALDFSGISLRERILRHGEDEYIVRAAWRKADAPLLALLRGNAADGRVPFHMPGHKRNAARFAHLSHLSAAEDITEIDGFDNLHGAEGILADAMARAAALWHSDRSFFLVNGSSGGILAGIRALTRRGDTVIVSRNAHKSVYHAIELCGLRPVFLTPPYDAARGMFLSLPPAAVEAALNAHPEAALVILTSPTYEGVLSDTAAIARIAHACGAALLVDEAHGAHLSLHPAFPAGAVAAGADITVQSVHKTLPSLTQTAVLHVRGPRVDPGRLAHQLAVFQTSSPSYLLMASIDGCVRTLAEDGSVMSDWARRLADFDAALGALSHLYVPYHGECGAILGVFAYDPSKIFITGADGAALAAFFRGRGMEPEMVTPQGVLMMSGAGDTPKMMTALAAAIREADAAGLPAAPAEEIPLPEIAASEISPEAALEAQWEAVPLREAIGRVCAEYVWAYPPGIPILIPGERIPPDALYGAAELHATRSDPPRTVAVIR